MALSRLEFAHERTGKMPITYVSLLRRRKIIKRAYVEGTELLNNHKLHALEGYEEAGQVLIRSSSSSSIAQTFEWYADCADKFVTDVESGCPLRRDTFRSPFVRQVFEGKTVVYQRMKESQRLYFDIWPSILEGRGVEAHIRYRYFDPQRLDKSFSIKLVLRLSESTDIVGTAINCLQSSASLLNLAVEDAMGELTQLHNLQDMSCSYAQFCPWVDIIQECYPDDTKFFRSDPLCCCQVNGCEPVVSSSISSDLSHIFPEETIFFGFECYVPALEYRLPLPASASDDDEHGMQDRHRRQPLELTLLFAPHFLRQCVPQGNCIFEVKGGKEEERTYNSIQQTFDTAIRSEAIDCLIHQPEVTKCAVYWRPKHGAAGFFVKKPSTHMATTVPKTRGRYSTCNSAKRKRQK
ncbi:uncharacterized protein LOC120660815 [Panicum virgatum]|uniref:Uncharacterized protein n=1 Tax=Panicum virgatum TaxID=38727 RepID=A0A8T0W156_PANVG|nr:uncharacterized protein LOC120660815 [Panicum virgatum]KAG2639666.1 hypothetical protein PVAP13_2KG029032 [Panicum virgatum]